MSGRRRVGRLRAYLQLLRWVPIWTVPLLVVGFTTALYQSPLSFVVDVGTGQDQAYVRNFHTRLSDGGRDYRWSAGYGYVVLPGVGGGRIMTVTLALDTERTTRVSIIVNGAALFDEEMQAGWREVSVVLDGRTPAALASRDTVVEIRAPVFPSPDAPAEPRGVKLDRVLVTQWPSGGPVQPPYGPTLLLAGTTLLTFLLAGSRLWGRARLSRARYYGLGAAVVLASVEMLLLSDNRVPVMAAAGHIAITLVSMLAIQEGIGWAARRWGGVGAGVAASLAGVTSLAFGLRYFGMALPQSVIIDMPWHMKWLRTLLAGDWQALYFPGGLSRVPAEWGLDLLIPKSPLFYFAVAPLSLLPVDLETAVKWLICLLDAGLVLVAYRLARGCGAGRWGGMLAAGLYAVMPLAFRAFTYGILPTIFAQWLSALLFVAVTTYAIKQWSALRWVGWVGMVALATLALLAFPTVAVFATLVLLACALAWEFAARREYGAPHALARVALLLALGWLFSVIAYYGLYINPVAASASALLQGSGGTTNATRWPGGPVDLLAWTADYVVSVLPALLAFFGLGVIFARARVRGEKRDDRVWLLAVWLGIAPLFMLVNYRVDMIGKHLFFTMLPVAAAGGVFLWQLCRKERWGPMLASFVLVTVGWQALVFWFERLTGAAS